LTQLAAGGFLVLWLGDVLASFLSFLRPLQNFLGFGAGGMLAVTAIALLASTFHLGRPLYAYKALKMWKRSWLSREVLLFTVFSFVGALYGAYLLAAHAGNFGEALKNSRMRRAHLPAREPKTRLLLAESRRSSK